VCSVVVHSHVESLSKVVDEVDAGVDEVVSTTTDAPSGRHTRTVEPLYE